MLPLLPVSTPSRRAWLRKAAHGSNRSLPLGQIFRGTPYGANLLLDQGRSFRRDSPIRQLVADHRRRHRRVLNLPPELQPPIPQMLSN